QIAKAKAPTQAVGAELGLAVRQLQSNDVHSRSQLVAREGLRERGAERIGPLVAEERHPIRRAPNRVPAGRRAEIEGRHAARADVGGVVDPAYPKIEADVLAEIGPGHVLLLDVDAKVAIENHRVAERKCVADCPDVDARVTDAAVVEPEDV